MKNNSSSEQQQQLVVNNSNIITSLIGDHLTDGGGDRKKPKPIHIYLAVGRGNAVDSFRKPKRGMWDLFLEKLNTRGQQLRPGRGSAQIDYTNSFYVGNNCGREGDQHKDDLKFARACGLRFFTEEMLWAFE